MSAPRTRALAVGERVRWDGDTWSVVAMDGVHVTVTNVQGRSVAVEIRTLLRDLGQLAPDDGADGMPETSIAPLLDNLDAHGRRRLKQRLEDVNEILTGYRSGLAEAARVGEPHSAYAAETKLMDRYQAKATERGVSVATVRRWVKDFQLNQAAGLIDRRTTKETSRFGNVDQRWIDAAAAVMAEHVNAAKPSLKVIRFRTDERVALLHPDEEVNIPSRSTADRVLKKLAAGTGALSGATKQKRSIANRPAPPYGSLVATRPGEYLLLDSTTTDVFALDRRTGRWTNTQLTIGADQYSGAVASLRLNPVSTKSIDAALVVFEAFAPSLRSPTMTGVLPYVGVPSLTLIPEDKFDYELGGLPPVAVEAAVVDHGRIWVSTHFMSVCARLGISVQPARKKTPTDKSMVERLFETINDGILQYLPGYKGPDVYSRGAAPEDEAVYFVDELEQIIREWIVEVYHERPSLARAMPDSPRTKMSPRKAYEHGVARAGYLRVPLHNGLIFDFLNTEWRKIRHDGVQIDGLMYNSRVLNPHRNNASPFTGSHNGKWAFRFDPDDVSHIYFQDPASNEWHVIPWVKADQVGLPFSSEALRYAHELARSRDEPFDEVRHLRQLLDRWNDDARAANRTERRMMLRQHETQGPLHESRYQEAIPALPIATRTALGYDQPDEDNLDDEDPDDDGFYGDLLGTAL